MYDRLTGNVVPGLAWSVVWMFSCLGVAGCVGRPPWGLAPTTRQGGPVVRFDLSHRPLPEMPFPNDAATRRDPGSPTGVRLNVSLFADTRMEQEAREHMVKLDGFGVYSPIWVSFDKPLGEESLGRMLEQHKKPRSDHSGDFVLVIDVDPRSRKQGTFGQVIPLDVCSGNFPLTLGKFGLFFPNDPHCADNNVLFEEHEEDMDGDGKLDPGEDRDFDGVLDHPNIWPLHACDEARRAFREGATALFASVVPPVSDEVEGCALLDPEVCKARCADTADCEDLCNRYVEAKRDYDRCIVSHLMTCYERQTNTLIVRPLVPLREKTKYAVVLTNRLQDDRGNPVESPFPFVNHADQTPDLAPLGEILPRLGLSVGDVAFAWTFTTGTRGRDLLAIRAGLYGHGPLSWLATEFPVDQVEPLQVREGSVDNPHMIPMQEFVEMARPLVPLVGGGSSAGAEKLMDDLAAYVDYLVAGRFVTPYFLVDKDGVATERYPADDDEAFAIDVDKGSAVVGPQWVTFLCAVPRHRQEGRPVDVVLYAHGYVGLYHEMLGFAGVMARFGMASCSLEAMGHGLALPPGAEQYTDLIRAAMDGYGFAPLLDSLVPGRARDLNNDGFPDSGGDFWTADLFHTRDVVRQTVVDHLQFVRILRSLDGERTWSFSGKDKGPSNIAGDFDGDRQPDFGGPHARYFVWGQSLGGFVSTIVAAVDPAIRAAAPVSGGAGLTSVAVRSQNFGVPQAVMLPLLGPFVMGNPPGDGKEGIQLSFYLADVVYERDLPFRFVPQARVGDRVILRNLQNGQWAWAVIPESRRFRMAVAADALTATEKRAVLGMKDDDSNLPVKVSDPTALGDPLEILVCDGDVACDRDQQKIKVKIDTNDRDVVWQGALYPAGSRLAALQKGYGYARQSPDLRRILGIAQMILEEADPAAYAPHLFQRPFSFPYEEALSETFGPVRDHPPRVLVVPMIGDLMVPVDTEFALARAAGILRFMPDEEDEARWGEHGYQSENDVLIGLHVLEGVDRLRWFDADVSLADPCNLSQGTDAYLDAARVDPPVRPTLVMADGGYQALRAPYIPQGDRHGFDIPRPEAPFDADYYMTNLVAWWMRTEGKPEKIDDLCYQDGGCSFFGNTGE